MLRTTEAIRSGRSRSTLARISTRVINCLGGGSEHPLWMVSATLSVPASASRPDLRLRARSGIPTPGRHPPLRSRQKETEAQGCDPEPRRSRCNLRATHAPHRRPHGRHPARPRHPTPPPWMRRSSPSLSPPSLRPAPTLTLGRNKPHGASLTYDPGGSRAKTTGQPRGIPSCEPGYDLVLTQWLLQQRRDSRAVKGSSGSRSHHRPSRRRHPANRTRSRVDIDTMAQK